jgi:hypothetical protein
MRTCPHPVSRLCEEFQREVGIAPGSALITRKQLSPYEEAKAVKALSEGSDIARYAKSGVI